MEKPEASEIEYLKWFHRNADFGPAHTDVVLSMQEYFEDQTGKKVPKTWSYANDEDVDV